MLYIGDAPDGYFCKRGKDMMIFGSDHVPKVKWSNYTLHVHTNNGAGVDHKGELDKWSK